MRTGLYLIFFDQLRSLPDRFHMRYRRRYYYQAHPGCIRRAGGCRDQFSFKLHGTFHVLLLHRKSMGWKIHGRGRKTHDSSGHRGRPGRRCGHLSPPTSFRAASSTENRKHNPDQPSSDTACGDPAVYSDETTYQNKKHPFPCIRCRKRRAAGIHFRFSRNWRRSCQPCGIAIFLLHAGKSGRAKLPVHHSFLSGRRYFEYRSVRTHPHILCSSSASHGCRRDFRRNPSTLPS